jgi:hypothetical protein
MIATPKEPLAPNRIEPKAKERFAELHGLGATVREAATAMGFSVITGEELMRKPEYRRIFEATRRGHGRGMQGEVAENVRLMLRAVKKDGTPDLATRQKGVCRAPLTFGTFTSSTLGMD